MNTRKESRMKRKRRIAAIIRGTEKRPRVAVFRSNTSITAQFINDVSGKTLISSLVKGKNEQAAKKLGSQLAIEAKKKSITTVVFDRGGFRYHGAVKALAEALREGGIKL